MSGSITPARFHELGWKVLAYAACTRFRTGSLGEGIELARAITGLAEASGRHPDVDLRSGGVSVRLRVNEKGELNEDDVALAGQISAAARELGVPVDLDGVQSYQIAIDALDIPGLMPFWEAVLGYVQIGDILIDPRFEGPVFWFQQMDVPRPQRNRIHIDLYLPEDQARARVEAGLAAGGRIANDANAPEWWTLADPEGNEVDVAPWPDAD
jgi:4a-hydroxytetrahydrobiopterin dehydratase